MVDPKLKKITVTPAIKYFFAVLEKEHSKAEDLFEEQTEDDFLPIEEVEAFVRSLKTQNIFIFTVGLSGKQESTILSKAIFNLNKVIKIYYSTSFDERDSGFIRVRSDLDAQQIVIERLHGFRPIAERMYQSADQCHIVRFLTQWIIRRIDWKKTKISTLELYDAYLKLRQEELEQKLQEELYADQHWMESAEVH